MKPRLRNTILLLLALLSIFICTMQLRGLEGGNHHIRLSHLFKIDSVQLQGRAYIVDHKGARTIEFRDVRGRLFAMPSQAVKALNYYHTLYDTLQYSGLTMDIYTDEAGSRTSKQLGNTSVIKVWDIVINGVSQISMDELNRIQRGNAQFVAFLWIAIACGSLFTYLYYRSQK